MDVFVSYARADAVAVRRLTEDIDLGGHQVWFDRDLHGGEDWWARILDRIRTCSVLVFALSEHSLRSQACVAELEYAEALGVSVLPIQVGAVPSLATTPVAAYQVVDYRQQSSAVGFRVMSALADAAARRDPLPDPLPPEPAVPFAYLSVVGRRIAQPDLRATEQAAIIGQLRHALRNEADEYARADAQRLLEELRRHPTCTWANAQEIDAVLNGAGSATATGRGRISSALRGGWRGSARSASSGAAPVPPADSRPAGPPRRRTSTRARLAVAAGVGVVLIAAGAGLRAGVGGGAAVPAKPPRPPSTSTAPPGYDPPTVVGEPIALPDPVNPAVSPDGGQVYVTNNFGDSVSVLDPDSPFGPVASSITVGDQPRGLAVSPDGARVYVANNAADSVSVIDARSGAVMASPIGVGDGPWSLAVSPDGARVYVTNGNASSVSVINALWGAVVGSPIEVGPLPRGIAVSPDSRRVYVVVENNNSVSVIDTGLC